MGEFLAVSAFHERTPEQVEAATTRYIESQGLALEALRTTTPDDARDSLVFPQANGWTVVLWPSYFNIHDIPLCAATSLDLGALVSAIHVYDGDYWAHSLFDRGERLDRFASVPGYFAEDEDEATAKALAWTGDANALGDAFGVDPATLSPYLRHVDLEDETTSKAFPDDAFDLAFFWVFTDFWRRAGIAYPDDVSGFDRVLRLPTDFGRQLPTMADDEL